MQLAKFVFSDLSLAQAVRMAEELGCLVSRADRMGVNGAVLRVQIDSLETQRAVSRAVFEGEFVFLGPEDSET